LAGISNERTKFYHVISQLHRQYTAEVEAVIIFPPQKDPYTTARAELIKELSPSREQRIDQFLTLQTADLKPFRIPETLHKTCPEHTG
jgi:hypothetical protein